MLTRVQLIYCWSQDTVGIYHRLFVGLGLLKYVLYYVPWELFCYTYCTSAAKLLETTQSNDGILIICLPSIMNSSVRTLTCVNIGWAHELIQWKPAVHYCLYISMLKASLLCFWPLTPYNRTGFTSMIDRKTTPPISRRSRWTEYRDNIPQLFQPKL